MAKFSSIPLIIPPHLTAALDFLRRLTAHHTKLSQRLTEAEWTAFRWLAEKGAVKGIIRDTLDYDESDIPVNPRRDLPLEKPGVHYFLVGGDYCHVNKTTWFPQNATVDVQLVGAWLTETGQVWQEYLRLGESQKNREVFDFVLNQMWNGETVPGSEERIPDPELESGTIGPLPKEVLAGEGVITQPIPSADDYEETNESENGDRKVPPPDAKIKADPVPGGGVAPRNEWFLAQYEANGTDTYHKPAEIHAKWEAMNATERAKICPDSPNKITKAAVAKSINRALAARDGQKSANSKQKPQEKT